MEKEKLFKEVKVKEEGVTKIHSRESFIEAGKELAEIIKEFNKKHGIGIMLGFGAFSDRIQEDEKVLQGAILDCPNILMPTVVEKILVSYKDYLMIQESNERSQN